MAYLAEKPAHAVAELLQSMRGRPFKPEHLLRADPANPGTYHPLALVEVVLPAGIDARLPDLSDPATLVALGIRPDHLASHERTVTQAIARKIHDHAAGYPGFRWWSALTGDWHAAVVFLDRVDVQDIGYGMPDPTHAGHPAVLEAARFLRMR